MNSREQKEALAASVQQERDKQHALRAGDADAYKRAMEMDQRHAKIRSEMSQRMAEAAMESATQVAARNLASHIDNEVMKKLLDEGKKEELMATTKIENTSSHAKAVSNILSQVTDEEITVDFHVSSMNYETQVRVMFPKYGYGHNLGCVPESNIQDLVKAMDKALEGLQDHIEKQDAMTTLTPVPKHLEGAFIGTDPDAPVTKWRS